MLQFIAFVASAALFLVLGFLRYSKGIAPLRQFERGRLPGLPGPKGLVCRLDGLERKQRKVLSGPSPKLTGNGEMVLPEAWEGDMTVGRMASIAHMWGLCMLWEDDPKASKDRENVVKRTTMVTFFALLICVALCVFKGTPPMTSLAIFVAVWAFLTFAAIPSQFREWKAVELAKKRLKEVELWPKLRQDGEALELCLTAMAWCRVAGFRRVLPR